MVSFRVPAVYLYLLENHLVVHVSHCLSLSVNLSLEKLVSQQRSPKLELAVRTRAFVHVILFVYFIILVVYVMNIVGTGCQRAAAS